MLTELLVILILILFIVGVVYFIAILPAQLKTDSNEREFLKTANCDELRMFILDGLRNGTKSNQERAEKLYNMECQSKEVVRDG